MCKAIRLGFLQQSAMNENDNYVPLIKQFKMAESILNLYTKAGEIVEKGIPISKIKEYGLFEEYIKMKLEVSNEEYNKYDEFDAKVNKIMSDIDIEYKDYTM